MRLTRREIVLGALCGTQFVGELQQQFARVHLRIRDVGRLPVGGQFAQEAAAQQRLAGADLAHHLDEAFAARQAPMQQVDAFVMALARKGEIGIGRDAERQLVQAEMGEIRSSLQRNGQAAADRKPAAARLLCCKSFSQLRSSWMTVGLSRITSSRFSRELPRWPNSAPRRRIAGARQAIAIAQLTVRHQAADGDDVAVLHAHDAVGLVDGRWRPAAA